MTETGLLVLIAVIAIFILWLFWIRIPAQMARKRGRSALGWVLLTWLLSPLWIIVLLLIAGDSQEKVTKDIVDRMKER